jgi:transcriptional regulator with XRE-family HTH domain
MINNEQQRNLMMSYRARLGLNQSAAALRCGMSQQLYSQIERGLRKPADRRIAERIANALQVPVGHAVPRICYEWHARTVRR